MNGGAAATTAATSGDYAAATTGAATNNFAHLPPLQRKIMEVVSADGSDEGMHVQRIGRMCGSGDSEALMEAIELLMGDGLLYSTIDDLVSGASWAELTCSMSRRRRSVACDRLCKMQCVYDLPRRGVCACSPASNVTAGRGGSEPKATVGWGRGN